MSLIERAKRRIDSDSAIENQTKKQIHEIVRAYRHSWDVYSELLQNAVDAINRRYRILNDPDFYLYNEYRQKFGEFESDETYSGKIQIIVDVNKREIIIKDNGVGIQKESIEEFLLPQGSDKKIGQEYGFKGFGLTYIAFISEKFYISSKPFYPISSEASEFGLDGLFDWLIEDSEETTNFPDSPIPDAQTYPSTWNESWNTEIRLTLAEDYTSKFPAVSSVDHAIKLVQDSEMLDAFEFVLRTRTAIGNTRYLFNKAPIVPIEVNLTVIFSDREDGAISKEIPYKYFHPKEHEEVSIVSYDFGEYFEEYKKPTFSKSFRGLYHPVLNQTVGTRNAIFCDFALSAIASTRLSNIESKLKLDDVESGDVSVTYGIYLAIDGMPTGLRIDDWDTRASYLKRFYIVVDTHMDISNQLDPGRKGISQHFARLISEKAISLIGTTKVTDSQAFGSYAAKHIDYGKGSEDGGLPPQDFQNQITLVRERNKDKTDELQQLLQKYSSLEYPPYDEQEVIILFSQLQICNIIKGYKTVYNASSSVVYDAGFDYDISCAEENVFPSDPLGIGKVLVQDLQSRGESEYRHRNHFTGRSILAELCVEFKRSIGGFLNEIYKRKSQSAKDPKSIDLLITWDLEIPVSIQNDLYTIDVIPDNKRVFHSSTHRLGIIGEQNTEITCIVLKNVLSKILSKDSNDS